MVDPIVSMGLLLARREGLTSAIGTVADAKHQSAKSCNHRSESRSAFIKRSRSVSFSSFPVIMTVVNLSLTQGKWMERDFRNDFLMIADFPPRANDYSLTFALIDNSIDLNAVVVFLSVAAKSSERRH